MKALCCKCEQDFPFLIKFPDQAQLKILNLQDLSMHLAESFDEYQLAISYRSKLFRLCSNFYPRNLLDYFVFHQLIEIIP